MNRRPDPPPLPTDDRRFVAAGTALWGLALLVSLVFAGRLADSGKLWLLGTCASGFGLGLVGLVYVRRRAAAIARDAAAATGQNDPTL